MGETDYLEEQERADAEARLTFTERVVVALRAHGWAIHHMEEHGFEWWWRPEDAARKRQDGRDFYYPFDQAIGQALGDDMLAARRHEPLIPAGTGRIVCREKHGDFPFDTALAVIRERLEDDYWYDDWEGSDNPENDPRLLWETRARAISVGGNETEALNFLIERRVFEYEGFYFEHPATSPVA